MEGYGDILTCMPDYIKIGVKEPRQPQMPFLGNVLSCHTLVSQSLMRYLSLVSSGGAKEMRTATNARDAGVPSRRLRVVKETSLERRLPSLR